MVVLLLAAGPSTVHAGSDQTGTAGVPVREGGGHPPAAFSAPTVSGQPPDAAGTAPEADTTTVAPVEPTTEPRAASSAAASSPTSTAERILGTGGDREERRVTFIDILHRMMSSGLLSSAAWLDSFFADERYEAEANQSRFKIRYDAFREEGTGMVFQPDIDLRLVLPEMRRKTLLVVSGDPGENIETAAAASGPPDILDPPSPDRNVTTSLQYILRATEKINFTARAGARFRGGEASFFAGPRFRFLIPLSSWSFRFTEQLLWFSDAGWRSDSRFDIERPFPNDVFFRTSLDGIWTEDVRGYAYSLTFLLRRPLDYRRAVELAWTNSFQTRPVDVLEEVLLVLRYRQRIWRDWLFFEIAPQTRYPRERDFNATPGILFRLEMVFGEYRSYF